MKRSDVPPLDKQLAEAGERRAIFLVPSNEEAEALSAKLDGFPLHVVQESDPRAAELLYGARGKAAVILVTDSAYDTVRNTIPNELRESKANRLRLPRGS